MKKIGFNLLKCILILPVAGLVMHSQLTAQTIHVPAGSSLNSSVNGADYVFDDIGVFTGTNWTPPGPITVNSLQIGSGHVVFPGSTQIELATGNITFAPTSGGTITGSFNGNGIITSRTGTVTINTNGIGGGIQNRFTGTTALVKNGTATVNLNGNSNYSGGTTINAGVLSIAGVNSVGTGAVTINGGSNANLSLRASNVNVSAIILNGGTLETRENSYTQNALGMMTLQNTSIIQFLNIGGLDSYSFSNSSSLAWNGNLNLNGFELGTDKLRFGTSSSGLTLSQVNSIRLIGDSAMRFSLDSNGYLIAAIPEPSDYLLFSALIFAGMVYYRKSRQSVGA